MHNMLTCCRIAIGNEKGLALVDIDLDGKDGEAESTVEITGSQKDEKADDKVESTIEIMDSKKDEMADDDVESTVQSMGSNKDEKDDAKSNVTSENKVDPSMDEVST